MKNFRTYNLAVEFFEKQNIESATKLYQSSLEEYAKLLAKVDEHYYSIQEIYNNMTSLGLLVFAEE